MLSDSHRRTINSMIDDELRNARYTRSEETRKAALARVAELQALLPTEKPSRQDIIKELADAIVAASNEPRQPTSLMEAIFGTCR